MQDQIETKEKILAAALTLFASKGPDGTTIRNIAETADVNLASVNYHFASKMNLFREVILRGHANISQEINRLAVNAQSSADLAAMMFDMFISRHQELASIFKLMLSADSCPLPSEGETPNQYVGPPGGQALMSSIERDLKRSVDAKDMAWAVRSIFSHVVHMALLSGGTCPHTPKGDDLYSIPTIRIGVIRLTNLVIKDL